MGHASRMNHHLTAEHLSASLRECIENCSDCHDACTETLAHCLSLGDKYAAAEHVVALLDCAQACDTSRDFMLRGSPIHPLVCAAYNAEPMQGWRPVEHDRMLANDFVENIPNFRQFALDHLFCALDRRHAAQIGRAHV